MSGSPRPQFIRHAGPLLFPVHPPIGWVPGGGPQSWHPREGTWRQGGAPGQGAQVHPRDGLVGCPPPVFDFQLCSSLLKGGIYLRAMSEHGAARVPRRKLSARLGSPRIS